MLTNFFVLFTLPWWILMAVASVLLVVSLRHNGGKFAAFVAFVTLLAWVALGDLYAVFKAKEFSVWPIVICGVLYFVLGGAYSLLAWWKKAAKKRDHYENDKNEWLRARGVPDGKMPETLKAEWTEHLIRSSLPRNNKDWDGSDYWLRRWTRKVTVNGQETSIVDLKMYPGEHKAEIASWIALWPWCAVEFFCYDLIVTLTNNIRRGLEQWMVNITAWTFKGTENDYIAK